MRISTRLTFALAAIGFLLFTAYALHMVRAEERDLRSSVEREMSLIGRSLQVAVENALRDRQLEDVQTTIEELHIVDPTVDIRVYDTKSKLIAVAQQSSQKPTLSADALSEAFGAAYENEEVMRFEPANDPTRLMMSMPLVLDGDRRVGKLVVNRPLTDMRDDLRATKRAIMLSILGFVALTLLIGWLLGNFYITRPLNTLIRAMQRVRVGDLSKPDLEVSRGKEIQQMSHEFGQMVTALAHAQRRIEREGEERRRLLLGLQNADKLISIGQLSAGLAHEIGSPLQVLVGRARMLSTRSHDVDEVQRNATILIEQGERITQIVEQLLQFGRRQPPSISEVNLPQTVQNVLDLLAFEARRQDISLQFDSPASLPRIQADAGQVQQIIFNLLTNALAAAPAESAIHIRLRLLDSSVSLEISDDGPGVEEALREQLFEPFFTTRAGDGGTGLGLAIVQALVQEHSGTIEYSAPESGGSRFLVKLPRVQEFYRMETKDHEKYE